MRLKSYLSYSFYAYTDPITMVCESLGYCQAPTIRGPTFRIPNPDDDRFNLETSPQFPENGSSCIQRCDQQYQRNQIVCRGLGNSPEYDQYGNERSQVCLDTAVQINMRCRAMCRDRSVPRFRDSPYNSRPWAGVEGTGGGNGRVVSF